MDTFVDFNEQWFYQAMTAQVIESAALAWRTKPSLDVLAQLRENLERIETFYQTQDKQLVSELFAKAYKEFMG